VEGCIVLPGVRAGGRMSFLALNESVARKEISTYTKQNKCGTEARRDIFLTSFSIYNEKFQRKIYKNFWAQALY